MNKIYDLWRRRKWRRNDAERERLEATRPATVITGGSEGIGLALAQEFAKRRATVVLIARNEDKLSAAKLKLAEHSAQIHTIALDITEANACEALIAQLHRLGLHVHELINNAGIGLYGPYAEQSSKDIDQLINLNITALSRLCRAVLPDMLLRGRGGIINIASIGGLTPGPYMAAYYASKAYVVSLSRALAYETRGMGLTISCVVPGPVDTNFHQRIASEDAYYRRFLFGMSAESVARYSLLGYSLCLKLIVPGMLNTLLAVLLSVLPVGLTLPVVAFLTEPRDKPL